MISTPGAVLDIWRQLSYLMQVKDLEKRESRLKEVFKTQVSNFREACYCLFGYRVDMASQVDTHKDGPYLI